MAYSKEVTERFYGVLNNPQSFSVGRFDPKAPNVATGMTGAPACGDVMKLQLKLNEKEEIVDVFDHATVFNKNTPHVELAKELGDRGHSVLLVDYQPTSEMMVLDFAQKIKTRLPKQTKLFSLKLQETETSYAEWCAGDN